MKQKTNARVVYVSLPVRDVARSRAFWAGLGFGFDERFSDDRSLCLVVKEGSVYAMLIARDFFQTFTDRPVADGESTQVLLALDVGSRARVDEVVKLALESGGTRYLPPDDQGWMYLDRFRDPDGHPWEIAFIDEARLPKEGEGEERT
jgi:predicted lactoylglutathione lyase